MQNDGREWGRQIYLQKIAKVAKGDFECRMQIGECKMRRKKVLSGEVVLFSKPPAIRGERWVSSRRIIG